MRNATAISVAVVATVGFDGAPSRLVGAYGASPDGGQNPDAGLPLGGVGPRPVWVNETTVAWLQGLDGTSWQIVSAPDQVGGATTLLMSCTGNVPTQFDVLPTGEVIISEYTGTGNEGVTQIQAYPVTAGTKACGTPRSISKLTSTNGGSRAYDFSLSPDKTNVAYLAHDDVTSKTEVRVARVDGTTTPNAVGALGGSNRGPRWVGAGAFLSWGINAEEFDAGMTGNALAVATIDGGKARSAVSAPSGQDTQAIGNGYWSCGFAPAVGSSMSFFGVAGILGLRLARRRRR